MGEGIFMIDRKTWDEFRKTGLLWWINRSLHLFGWSIVVEVGEDGAVSVSYPAKTSWRGFDEIAEQEGFAELTNYIASDIRRLVKDVSE
jgi:hypothetical protein